VKKLSVQITGQADKPSPWNGSVAAEIDDLLRAGRLSLQHQGLAGPVDNGARAAHLFEGPAELGLENDWNGNQQNDWRVMEKPIHHGELKERRHDREKDEQKNDAAQHLVRTSPADNHQDAVKQQRDDHNVESAGQREMIK